MKKILTTFMFIILIALVVFPKESMDAGRAGIEICLYTIIPTLLPFFIISNILVSARLLDGVIRLFSPITRRLFGLSGNICFVYLTSALSGYPTGAKLTADLYKSNQISSHEAQRIALFSQITGPAFMTVIASSLLKIPDAFIYIFLAHHFAMGFLTLGYTLIFKKSLVSRINQPSQDKRDVNLATILNQSILGSAKTLALICCLVIFFYTITALIDRVGWIDLLYKLLFKSDIKNTPVKEIIFGFLEMTLGCIKISTLAISVNQKIAISCGFLSFGGLSIFFQSKTILQSARIKTNGLLIFKLCHGTIAYLLSRLMLKLYPLKIETANFTETTKAISYSYLYLPLIILIYVIFKRARRN